MCKHGSPFVQRNVCHSKGLHDVHVKFILLVFASAPVPSHSIALGEGNDKQRPLCCYPTGSDEGKQGEIWKSSLLKYTKAKAPMICGQISHRKCKRKNLQGVPLLLPLSPGAAGQASGQCFYGACPGGEGVFPTRQSVTHSGILLRSGRPSSVPQPHRSSRSTSVNSGGGPRSQETVQGTCWLP